MPWPTGGTTRGRCKPISGTKTSSIRCATPSYRRCGSKISGGPERSFVGLLREAVVQIDLDPQLLCLISQLLDQLGIGQPRDISRLPRRTDIDHLAQFLVRLQLGIKLRHDVALGIDLHMFDCLAKFWRQIGPKLSPLLAQ